MSDHTMPRLLFLYFARTSRLTRRPRSSRWSKTSTSDIQVPRPSELSRPTRRNGSLTTRTLSAPLRSGISTYFQSQSIPSILPTRWLGFRPDDGHDLPAPGSDPPVSLHADEGILI